MISFNKKSKTIARSVLPICVLTFAAVSQGNQATGSPPDLRKLAPAAYETKAATKLVPIDIQTADLTVNINALDQKTLATSKLNFQVLEPGRPMFLFEPKETASIQLDGKPLSSDSGALKKEVLPNGQEVRYLDVAINDSQSHTMEVQYSLDRSKVQYEGDQGFSTQFFMDDNVGYFLDSYAPSNFEYDQFKLNAHFNVTGLSSRGQPPQIFANAKVSHPNEQTWDLDFPEFYNSSAFYIHMTTQDVQKEQATFEGIQGSVPVTVYGMQSENLPMAMNLTLASLKEMESNFGPYSYPEVIIYLAPPGGKLSGMEYAGASVSKMQSISHEVSHFWFGRGVMPSGGNSGWIDEAIATWRDFNYSNSSLIEKLPVNLASFSPYELATPEKSYSDGQWFMAVLSGMANQNGVDLKMVLKQLYQEKKHQVIDTAFFEEYLQKSLSPDVKPLFDKYIFGKVS